MCTLKVNPKSVPYQLTYQLAYQLTSFVTEGRTEGRTDGRTSRHTELLAAANNKTKYSDIVVHSFHTSFHKSIYFYNIPRQNCFVVGCPTTHQWEIVNSVAWPYK